MSFDTYEQSRQKGEKITLYHFFHVNGEQFYYTDAEKAVELEGFDAPFIPIPVVHGSITASGSLDKAGLEIRMPRNVGLADGFRAYPPNEVVNVVIRQMHRDDSAEETLVVWTGRVIAASWKEDELQFTCEPISTSLRRSGLRRHYQLGCPHVLYGTQCLASKLLATTPDITVSSVSGTTVVLPPNWLPGDWVAAGKSTSKFIGGMMTWEYATPGEPVTMKRTILQIIGGVSVVLGGPPTGLAEGDLVKMILGCTHQMTDCETIHANIKNFGGQPWIPTKNPFGFANNFY